MRQSYSDYNILLTASAVHGRQTCSHINKKLHDTCVLYVQPKAIARKQSLVEIFSKRPYTSYTKVDNYDI
jgi:hypothetical protein